MFALNPGRVVYLHRDAIDFRKNINGLASLVEHELGLDAFAQAVFVFGNRRRDRIKILGWDRNGFWLLQNAWRAPASSGLLKTARWPASRCSNCTGCSRELTLRRCVAKLRFRCKKRPEKQLKKQLKNIVKILHSQELCER